MIGQILKIIKHGLCFLAIFMCLNHFAINAHADNNYHRFIDEGKKLLDSKKCNAELDKFNQAAKENPRSWDAHISKGEYFFCLEKHEQTLLELNKAEKVAKREGLESGIFVLIYCSQGQATYWMNRYEESLKFYQKALKLENELKNQYPDLYPKMIGSTHLGMSATFAALNKDEEALKNINETIKLFPNDAAAHIAKGTILSKLGFMEDALKSLDKAIELEPGNLRHYKHRKHLTAMQKRGAK